jgi:hypothetical protein
MILVASLVYADSSKKKGYKLTYLRKYALSTL